MPVGSLARQITLGALIAVIGASVLFGVTLYVSPTQSVSQSSTQSTGSSSTLQPNCPSTCIIIINNDIYGNNQPVTVAVGTKVVWVNNDSTQHTVTANNGAFGSPIINPGDNFSYTFEQLGTYSYHDEIHPMTGVVIVGPPYTYSSSTSTTVEYQAPNILIQGASLCPTNCVYLSPHLSAMIIVNATIPLSSLTLYVNNTLEPSSQEGSNNNTLTAYALDFKATPNNPEMPIVAGEVYAIEFVAVFSNGIVATATTTVTAG